MILDQLKNAGVYGRLHPLFGKAFEALGDPELLERPAGRYELEGERLFAMVQRYTTRPREQGKWEAHRKYIDIQYVVVGEEVMGYVPAGALKVTEAYDAGKDIEFLQGEGNLVRVGAGDFAIFWPHDAHMPTVAAGRPAEVVKVVVKVAV